jgi:uncharacterized repeat protein (TIGR02543 family)
MINTLKPVRSLISVLASASLVLTGLLGSAMPAQSSENTVLVANEAVATAELLRGKTIVVTGFAPNSTSLTAAMQKRIERFIKNNPDFDFVRCVGFADRSGTPATNKRLGIKRAAAGCAVAVAANPDVEVSRQAGKWNREFTGADIRRVSITLSNYATANITTTFNANGGDQGVTTRKQAAGTPKILGAPTRPGFIFAGWFTDQFAGTKVGDAGAIYTPRKSQTLWAQWTAVSSGGGSSSSSGGTSTISINFSWALDFSEFTDPSTIADDIQQALDLYCAEDRLVNIKVQVDNGDPFLVDSDTITKCFNNLDPDHPATQEVHITPGGLNFSSTNLPAIAPDSVVTVIVEFDSSISDSDFFLGSFGGGSEWEYDGDYSFTKDIVFTSSDILDGLVFEFYGGAF